MEPRCKIISLHDMKFLLKEGENYSRIFLEQYCFDCRAILALVFGVLVALLPHQSWLYALPLLYALAFPMRQIELRTELGGTEFTKAGLIVGLSSFFFAWFFCYNVLHG